MNLGGGIPHPYRPGAPRYDLGGFRPLLVEAAARLAAAARRPIRVEIEPGRYPVAGAGLLVCRVQGHQADADQRQGARARSSSWSTPASTTWCARRCTARTTTSRSSGDGAGRAPEPFVVAGPLCESGDVFTRDEHELLDPRPLPRPDVGDLLVLHDAGAYGAAMSSNYVSLGRAPQVCWDDGRATAGVAPRDASTTSSAPRATSRSDWLGPQASALGTHEEVESRLCNAQALVPTGTGLAAGTRPLQASSTPRAAS